MRRIRKYFYARREWQGVIARFDEDFYLERYSDVASAVKQGLLSSGLEHYKRFGRLEGRQAYFGHLSGTKTGEAFAQVEFQNLVALERSTKPLPYEIVESRAPVLNVFIPTLDRDLFFGGYMAFLNFLMRLTVRGYRLRFVVCEEQDFGHGQFAEFLTDRRWQGAFDGSEFLNAYALDAPIALNGEDSFIVYSCWTALDAAPLAAACGKKIVFFIQEYEPSFHAFDSFHFIAHSAYSIPHIAIFNSQCLRAYFEQYRIGVFSHAGGTSYAFEHAILAPPRRAGQPNGPPSLLFYARPEAHAARNLFSVGVLALRECARRGVISRGWTLTGIGATNYYSLPVGPDLMLEGIPKASPERYLAMIQNYTVGLSLMSAPHPGVVHFEWAAAGLRTVVNTTAERPPEFFHQYGPDLVPAAPTVSGIADAIEIAASQAAVSVGEGVLPCPKSWDEALPPEFMASVISAMEGPSGRIGRTCCAEMA